MDAGVAPSEIRPGDVIFLTPGLNDPIAEWIAQADTGIFSHAAIALDENNMVNAALRGLDGGRDLDAGGVLRSAIFDESDHRQGPPFIGRPNVDPGQALQRAIRFLEAPYDTPYHKSGFSAAKSLLMMAALCAAHSGDERLKERALKAGRLWSVEAEMEHRETPSFICAEFVAYCYDRPFTWVDFHKALRIGGAPGEEIRTPIGGSPITRSGGTADPAGEKTLKGDLGDPQVLRKCLDSALGVWRELREVADHTPRQMAALADVALYMEAHHHSFLNKCLGSGGRLAWEVLTGRGDAGTDAPDDEPDNAVLAPEVDDRVIPACLVTPRTLANASWLEWVKPLDVGNSSFPLAQRAGLGA